MRVCSSSLTLCVLLLRVARRGVAAFAVSRAGPAATTRLLATAEAPSRRTFRQRPSPREEATPSASPAVATTTRVTLPNTKTTTNTRATTSKKPRPLVSLGTTRVALPTTQPRDVATTTTASLAAIPRHLRKSQPLPVRGYNADALEAHYDRRPLAVGWRLNALGFPLLGWYGRLLVDQALGRSSDPAVQHAQGVALRQALVQSGSVALIKSGQALSLRPDLLRNPIWADELGKLVDAVGAFDDREALQILSRQLADIKPRLKGVPKRQRSKRRTKLQALAEDDDILSLFEFSNNHQSIASASIGQVYKARIRRGPALEAAIGKEAAQIWGGKTVAIKIQRPDARTSASLDMYLLRRTAMWLSKVRAGDLVPIADAFGRQLFGELDYVREANNCERFGQLYREWPDVCVPAACEALTRRKVLVMEWVDGTKGPWQGPEGIEMVRIGLRCSVDQLMTTGLFHADPHRGNLLQTSDNKLAFLDFGMMADIDEDDRYGLFGLVIGLQNKDLPLVTEYLLKLGFLKDTTQLDQLVPRLRAVFMNATGGTGKASDVNFARLQAELDEISRENILRFATPPFFTIIIRSLTILEGVALSVDPNFKLVRGAYPYVLRQLLSPERNEEIPPALQKLLVRLLTVNGEEKEIEWERLRDLLRLAQKASKKYDPGVADPSDARSAAVSRQTIELFGRFMTSRSGIFLKKPLVHELAEVIDGGASSLEANLFRNTPNLLLPGMNGPINQRRMEEMQIIVATFQDALTSRDGQADNRLQAMMDLVREAAAFLNTDGDGRDAAAAPLLVAELQSVIQMVAVEVLEIRGSRAMRALLKT